MVHGSEHEDVIALSPSSTMTDIKQMFLLHAYGLRGTILLFVPYAATFFDFLPYAVGSIKQERLNKHASTEKTR